MNWLKFLIKSPNLGYLTCLIMPKKVNDDGIAQPKLIHQFQGPHLYRINVNFN